MSLQGFGPKLPQYLNEYEWSGLWFHISSGECPRTRMGCQVEGRFPHSALSVCFQQLAPGNVQGIHTPDSFIRSFSRPHRAPSLRYHMQSGGSCPESMLSLANDCKTRWVHREILCLKEFRTLFTQGTVEQALGRVNGLGYLHRRGLLWLPIKYSLPFPLLLPP